METIRKVSVAIILVSLTFLLARIFIFVYSTKGLFNFGEPVFYFSALLSPFLGVLIGGVAFSLVDLSLGYPQYAVAALTIKALAGAVIGVLRGHEPNFTHRTRKAITISSCLIISLLLGLVGARFYSGKAIIGVITTFYAGENVLEIDGLKFLNLNISAWFWIYSAIAIFFYFLFSADNDFSWSTFSVLGGAFIIIFGYFICEHFMIPLLYDIHVNATLNIYINLGQAIIGSTLALLLRKYQHVRSLASRIWNK